MPTCEQAEVLYPSRLSLAYLQQVYCRDGYDADWAMMILSTYERRDVGVNVDPSKFNGYPN